MRPRLVEEGKPITTNNIDHQDEFEYHNQHMSIVDRTSSNISTSTSSNTNGHNSKKYTSSLSSLARKTRTNNVTSGTNTNGNTKGNTNSKIQTSIEIGPSKSSKQSNNGNIISSSLNQYQYPRQRQHQLQHQQGHDDIQIDEYAYASDRHFSSVSMAAQHQHQHEHKKEHKKEHKIRTSFEIGGGGGGGGGQHQMDDHFHHTSNNLPIHYNNMDIDQEKNSMEVDDANVNGTTNFNEIQKTYESIGTANSIQVPNNYYSYHEDQQNQYQQQEQYHLHQQEQQQHHTTQSFMNEKIETQTQIPSSSSFTPSRMEIDDTLPKSPLVVIDGPNVAYAYAEALNSSTNSSLSTANNKSSKNSIEPDVRGIEIAASYFINAGCRAQIVIPTYWLRRKPQNGTSNRTNGDNALMLTEQVEILQKLKSQNLLLCSPSTDDDDAYAIAVARREDSRSQSRRIQSPQVRTLQTDAGGGADSMSCDVLSVCGAFVLSNDLFRDASQRDGSGELHNWLRGKGGGSGSESTLPGRISYSFCDIGCMDLDFVANPRHLLVEIIERYNQKHSISYTSF